MLLSQIMDPRNESYNQIKMCVCVDMRSAYIYIWWRWLKLILHCSLKTYLSFRLGNICKKIWAILFLFFLSSFQAGIKVPIVLIIQTLVHILSFLFFMNNFCIAHASLLQLEFVRDGNNKNTRAFIW